MALAHTVILRENGEEGVRQTHIVTSLLYTMNEWLIAHDKRAKDILGAVYMEAGLARLARLIYWIV